MLTIIKDKEPSLEELQKLVGGYIEMHNIGNTHLIVNEEARIIGLPINKKAMTECQKILNSNIRTNHLRIADIYGDVVILKGKAKLT
tara:strand:- start:92 stop:352 length:261 start_codon:yes stop_codon:yes gene_type:complete